jgi:hypothetical protein
LYLEAEAPRRVLRDGHKSRGEKFYQIRSTEGHVARADGDAGRDWIPDGKIEPKWRGIIRHVGQGNLICWDRKGWPKVLTNATCALYNVIDCGSVVEFIMDSRPKRKRNPPRYLPVSTIARLMGMHPNSILWNIRQGYLKAELDRSHYRYLVRVEDYERWRQENYDD